MTNKVGFTEEQQREMEKMLGIATRAAWLTTASVTGTDQEIANAAATLISYIRVTYPDGPLHVKRSLDSIVQFCDLAIIFGADYRV
jgi:hypothetical protein